MPRASILALLALLAAGAHAQDATDSILSPVPPAQHMGVLDLATGRLHAQGSAEAASFAGVNGNVYANSCSSGQVALITDIDTLVDVARIPSRTSTTFVGTSDAYEVTSFQISYATAEPDISLSGPGAHLSVSFYDLFEDCQPISSQAAPIATFDLPGLPGSLNPPNVETKTIVIILPIEDRFCLVADGDGRYDGSRALDTFGFSIQLLDQNSPGGGILLASDPGTCAIGDGTTWGSNPLIDGSGIGNIDSLWREPTMPNCLDFGGSPLAGLYLIVSGSLVSTCTPGAEILCTPVADGAGCTPTVHTTGIARKTLGLGQFRVEAQNVHNLRPYSGFYGLAKTAVPQSFFQGFRCVKAPLIRLFPSGFTSGVNGPPDCSGTMSVNLNPKIVNNVNINAGDTLYFQYVYRDTAGSGFVRTSQAVRAFVLP